MAHDRADDLWFLAPGLMHHLGNALFAAQGQLQLASLASDRALPVHEALQRAQVAVSVLRQLLPGAGGPVAVAAALHGLAELLRVPLRDLGLRLVAANMPSGLIADGGVLVPTVLATVRALAAAMPHGLIAAIGLTVGANGDRIALRWQLEPGPGQLPFGLDWPAIAGTLGRMLPHGVAVSPAADAEGLLVALPAATGAEVTADSDGNLR